MIIVDLTNNRLHLFHSAFKNSVPWYDIFLNLFFPLSRGIKLASAAVSTIKQLGRRVDGTIRLLSEKSLVICQEERRLRKDLSSRDVADLEKTTVRIHAWYIFRALWDLFRGNNSSLSMLLSYLFSTIGGKRKTGRLPQPLPCLADKASLAIMERAWTLPEHVCLDTCLCFHSGGHTEHARSALLKEWKHQCIWAGWIFIVLKLEYKQCFLLFIT